MWREFLRAGQGEGGGNDTVNSSVDIVLPDNVEWLNLTGTDNLNATGNAQDNNLVGNAGSNRLEGGAGNDQLIGGAGADTLIGGTGDDYYEIDDAGDTIVESAGEGSDFVRSTVSHALAANVEGVELAGTADLDATGNALDNSIYGNQGANTLAGGAGNDFLSGGAGNDIYVFNRGDGQDSIDDLDVLGAVNTLRFGVDIADTDVVGYRVGDDMVLKLKGSSEQVAFYSYYGADTVDGGVVSNRRIDRVEFGNGVVWNQAMIQTAVDRAANNQAPVLNTPVPALQAHAGDAFSYVVPVDAIVDPDAGDSIVYSVSMPDGSPVPAWLAFDAATRTLSGTPEASDIGSLQFVLWGTDDYGVTVGRFVMLGVSTMNHAPVLSSALPDQTGSQGNAFSFTVAASAFTDPDGDALAYSATLADGSALPTWLQFNAATRTFSGTPTSTGTTSVRVIAKDTGNLVASDVFDIVVGTQGLVLKGTSGVDYLYGGYGNDTFDGGPGDDTLQGRLGNDVYLFGLGDGQDTIIETGGNADVLRFKPGITPQQVGVIWNYWTVSGENSLVLTVDRADGTATNDLVYIRRYFDLDDDTQRVDRIEFSDGTVWTYTDIQAKLPIVVTEGHDFVLGFASADVIDGGGGNDTLSGNGGNDILKGGAGNDHLYGDLGDDTLDGGAGDDDVQGGMGNDYLMGGDGDDRLLGYTAYSADDAGNDVLYGGAGTDRMFGGRGNDTYLFGRGDGNDLIGETPNDTGPSMDILRLGAGISPDDVALIRQGINDLVIAIDVDQVVLSNFFMAGDYSIERIEFDNGNGAVWTADDVRNRVLISQVGTSGNDVMDGGTSGDVMAGGAGNDTYVVDSPDDVVIENLGEGKDTVRSSITYVLPDNVENLLLTGSYSISGTGNALDNLISGNGAHNVLSGGQGADRMIGGKGDDTYVVDNVLDTVVEYENEGFDSVLSSVSYTLGDNVEYLTLTGSASIDGSGNNLNNFLDGNPGDNTLGGGAGNDIIRGYDGDDRLYGGDGDDSLVGDSGDDILDGGQGNDSLSGGAGDDILFAGIGDNDTLSGGSGNDIYRVDLYHGEDLLDDYSGTMDVVEFGVGVNPEDLELTRDTYTLFICNRLTSDSLTISVFYTPSFPDSIEEFRFSNGTSWNRSSIYALNPVFQGTEANDWFIGNTFGNDRMFGYGGDDRMYGSVGQDHLNGGAGNDELDGGDDDDVLLGESGNDILKGGNGDDFLDGGEGADSLFGGAGNDIYLFSRGFGQDIVDNYDPSTGKLDIVQFDGTIAREEIVASRSGNDLILSVDGTSDVLTIRNYLENDGITPYSVEQIRFHDGTVWNLDTINNMLGVTPMNNAPELLQPLPDQTATEGAAFSYTVASNAFVDPDAGDVLSYTATLADGSPLPTWLSFDSVTRTFSGTPANTGTASVRVTASDAGDLSASDVFDIVVNAPNHAPVLSVPLPDRKLAQDRPFSFTIASSAFTDPDVGDLLSYSATLADGSALPSWLNFDASARTFSGTLDTSDTLSVRVMASDTGGLSVSDVFDIEVYRYLVGTTGADILSGGAGDDQLYGDAGDDTLYGGAGNDRLDGGAVFGNTGSAAGNDTAYGGPGDDVYWNIDTVIENADEGIDTWVSRFGGVLPPNVENLSMDDGSYMTYSYAGSVQAYGNDLDNILTTAGEGFFYEIVDGRGGADTVIVQGDDRPIIFIDNPGDRIILNGSMSAFEIRSTVSYTLIEPSYFPYPNENIPRPESATGRLALLGSDAIDGTGNVLNNVLTSHENTASNILSGGAGNDIYVIDANDRIMEEVGGGNDKAIIWVGAADNNREISLATAGLDNVERVGLAGTANNVVLRGNAEANDLFSELSSGKAYLLGEGGDDRLVGGRGNDYLDGGTGADYMEGGSGNDIYIVDNVADQVVEYQSNQYNIRDSWDYRNPSFVSAGGGYDTVYSSVSRTLEAEVEALILTGADAIDGIGNALDNELTGNSANNILTGGAGNDIYYFGRGSGQDTIDSYDPTTGKLDVVRFDATIVPGDVLASRSGNDLILSIDGTSDTLTIRNYLENDGITPYSVEQIRFYDGTIWDLDTVKDMLDSSPVNHAPELSQPLPDQSATEGVAFSYTFAAGAFTDPDADTLTYSATLTDGSPLPAWLSFDATTRTFSGTPSTPSPVSVRVTAKDAGNLTASDVFDIVVDVQNLTLNGTANADTLTGGSGNDTLNGYGGNDTLVGNAGNDVLDGGAGDDTMQGGAGDDTYVVDDAGDGVIENAGQGTDTVRTSIDYTLGAHVENLTLTGIFALTGIGNALDNVLRGNGAGSALHGLAGNDTLYAGNMDTAYGGDGNDVLLAENASGNWTYLWGEAGDDTLMGGAGSTGLWGGAGNDTIFGGAGVNYIWGDDFGSEAGDDVIHGGNGYDFVSAGGGNDIVYGNDGDDTLSGNEGDDSLYGGAGNDSLIGGAGDDLLEGGTADIPFTTSLSSLVVHARGTPVQGIYPVMRVYVDGALIQEFVVDAANYTAYVVDTSGLGPTQGMIDVVFVNDDWRPDIGEDRNLFVQKIEVNGQAILATAAGVFYDVGGGTQAFDGANLRLGQETLQTNGALRFNLGDNDTLDGGTGADRMAGANGNDTYIVDDANDVVTEIVDGGIDTVRSGISYLLGAHVENLVLTGAAALDGTGNALNNLLMGNAGSNHLNGGEGIDTLIGNDGNDRLDGGAGNDILYGGQGDDIYVVDSMGDGVYENANQGWDTVESAIGYTLGDNVEALILTGTAAVNGTGNALDNVLRGNGANNTLSGGLGNDTYLFGSGFGQDIVDSYDPTAGKLDIVQFDGTIAPEDVIASRSGNDLILSVDGTSDVLTIRNYLENDGITPYSVEQIRFHDGTVWDLDTVKAMLNVVPVNHAPELSQALPDQTATEGEAFSYTVASGAFTDPDAGDVLSYSATLSDGSPLPAWLSFDAATRTFSGTPATAGTYSVTVTAEDAGSLSASDVFDIVVGSVVPVNHAPELSHALPDQSATEGAAFSYTVAAGAFTDPDSGDSLTYTATLADGSSLPAWLSFDAVTRTFSGIPSGSGAISVRVTAEDTGELTASDVFELVVASTTYTTINGTSGSNTLNGTAGNDIINGLAGNDTIHGNGGNDIINGGPGNDTLNGGEGNDLFLVEGDSGSDTVNGGDGFDEIRGSSGDDIIRLSTYGGANTVERIDGGGGYNRIAAGANFSNLDFSTTELVNIARIDGGGGDNQITGSQGDDVISGGAGGDTLRGGAGDDQFVVEGDSGNDTVSGGDGFDQVMGSAGDDIIRFATYGGVNTVERIDGGGGYNRIVAGANFSNLDFSGTELVNIARIDGGAGDNQITGSQGDDVISGGAGGDTLRGGGGNDQFVVEGDSGSDTVSGGDGFDQVVGSAGDDIIRFANYGGINTVERIDGGGGYNRIAAGTNFSNLDFSTTELVNIARIEGGGGDNQITGSQGDDVISGGGGMDTLRGGAGNDTYLLGRGYGKDTVIEQDATAGNTDTAQFLSGVAADQIWFRHVGSDLEASIIGTSDKLVIKDWYLGTDRHVEQFKTTDGGLTLLDSQVESLVAAMASFAPPSAGQTTLPQTYQDALAGVIAANWQ